MSQVKIPKAPKNAHIGILGGSFDPPHLCHQLVALSFLALEPIDELWIIPCSNHAVKQSLSPFLHRMAMCKLAFGRLRNCHVLDIENRLLGPSYTVHTLKTIKSLRPDLKLVLGIGSDLVASFSTWHEAHLLNSLSDFVIFERENYPLGLRPPILENARLHQGYVLPDTNSTKLRKFLNANRAQEPCPFLDLQVFNYLKNNKLY